jgi:hypothetical protein
MNSTFDVLRSPSDSNFAGGFKPLLIRSIASAELMLGYSVALLPAFDDARRFARHGDEKGHVRVYAYENRWFIGRKGSYISLSKREEMTVTQLSLLMRPQYFVVLSSDVPADHVAGASL